MKSKRLRLELPSWSNFTLRCAMPDGDEGEAGSDTGSAGGQNPTDPPKDPEPIKDPDAKIRSLTEEKDRHYRKLQEQENELKELRDLKKQQDDAKLSADEKTQRAISEKEQTIVTLTETTRRLAIENAFLIANTVKWHNPAVALKLADLSDVKVEDGEVKNPDVLKAAIEKLSKDNPYLVASSEPEPEKKKVSGPSTGTPPAKPLDPTRPSQEYLQTKYAALRNR